MRYLWNYLLSEGGYYQRRTDPRSRPFVFSIETTSVCNLACVMCPYKELTRPHEMMDIELFVKIVDEVCGHNGAIWLHNLGEPLAHPRFVEFVRHVKRRGLPCGFSTNATLLDERRAGQVLESGLDDLILCMDGITRETYEALRVGADFDQVTANIERFLRLKRSRGLSRPRTVVQLIYMKETERQVADFERRWRPLADGVRVKRFSTWANQVPSITALSAPEHRYEPTRVPGVRHPCAYLWRNVVVTANGDVIPCCADYDARMVMGNVGRESLEDIWHGERFRQMRADHLAGRFLGTCAECLEWVGGAANPTYPFGAPVARAARRAVGRVLRG
jgi:radical SAM protein with 4Fe4S-binding SPASM domain